MIHHTFLKTSSAKLHPKKLREDYSFVDSEKNSPNLITPPKRVHHM
jgi:hypothetical protein